MLQSKSPILPHPQTHTAVTVAGTQVLNSSQFKQLTSQATLVSTPQLITSQSQIINGLQAISTSLPPGLTWTTHGGLQSHAVIAQNPIFIRSSNQQDMFIQSQPATPTPIQPQPGMGQMIHHQQHHHQKPKQVVTFGKRTSAMDKSLQNSYIQVHRMLFNFLSILINTFSSLPSLAIWIETAFKLLLLHHERVDSI